MSGFVYIWRDKKHNRYYIGSHWGQEDDGYICSSLWMKRSYKRRPNDFRRRILSRITTSRLDLLDEEQRWLNKIKPEEIKIRYYNLRLKAPKHWYHDESSNLTIGQKISASKKGKSTGKRDPSIGQTISTAKKKKFEERREQTGKAFSEEHREAMSRSRMCKTQTEESNKKRSATMKQKFESGELVVDRAPMNEETKNKISAALVGIERSEETKAKMSRAQSKKYRITFFDGRSVVVHGLKTFCAENGIPYVTARKAFEVGSSIKKFDVESILLVL